MRRGDRLSWILWGLLLGCGGGSEDEAGSTSSGAAGSTGTAATSTGAPLPTTGTTSPGETGMGEGGAGCLAPLESCEGVCVDSQHDPRHCGGCGASCPEALVCVAGECALACGLGATACGQMCSVLASDPAHCGSCEHACAPGVACVDGSCAPDCAAGEQVCGEQCVDTGKDEAHCGACDASCPEGQPCVYGTCVSAEINHLLISGQSLSCGATSPVVSAAQIYGNMSFNTGVRAGGAGLIVALSGCWFGMNAGRGAAGVGRATK